MKKWIKRIVLILIILLVLIALSILGLNLWVTLHAKKNIVSSSQELTRNYDCILILGAGLKNGQASPMLTDRLEKGIELYKQGKAPKLLMSGEHGTEYDNEVKVMKQYAIDAGVPSSDIFMDHAGFSTYDSIWRAKHVFSVQNPIIVTQRYHLYRAVYIAQQSGLSCTGIASDGYQYGGKPKRLLREFLARCKDFITTATETPPAYEGDLISITGNGDETNDCEFEK